MSEKPETDIAEIQLAWDRALIETWRKAGSLLNAVWRWEEKTGLRFSDHIDQIKRTPTKIMPWKIGVRVFVAGYLPKINDRMWDQKPERDEALIQKLQTTNYDTQKRQTRTEQDRAIQREAYATKKSTEITKLDITKYMQRNDDTNWKVVKASRRHTK